MNRRYVTNNSAIVETICQSRSIITFYQNMKLFHQNVISFYQNIKNVSCAFIDSAICYNHIFSLLHFVQNIKNRVIY
jgi:hypothetical protein